MSTDADPDAVAALGSLIDTIADRVAEKVLAALGNGASTLRPRLLSTAEAAQLLGVGRTTIHALIRSGELDSRMIGGRRLIPATEIDRIIAG